MGSCPEARGKGFLLRFGSLGQKRGDRQACALALEARTKDTELKPTLSGSWRRNWLGLAALTVPVLGCSSRHDGAAASTPHCAAPATTSSSFYDGVSFLFQGDCATQKNVADGAFVRQSVAVLRGR